MSLGWRVHGWRWPVVWWARRKPRSMFRQWLWSAADRLDWHLFGFRRIRRARLAGQIIADLQRRLAEAEERAENSERVALLAAKEVERLREPYHECVSLTYNPPEKWEASLLRIRRRLKTTVGWWNEQDEALERAALTPPSDSPEPEKQAAPKGER